MLRGRHVTPQQVVSHHVGFQSSQPPPELRDALQGRLRTVEAKLCFRFHSEMWKLQREVTAQLGC